MFKTVFDWISEFFSGQAGMSDSGAKGVALLIFLVGIGIICYVLWKVSRKVMYVVFKRLAGRTRTTWDDHLVRRRAFYSIAHLVPWVILKFALPSVMVEEFPGIFKFLDEIIGVYLVFVLVSISYSFLNGIGDILHESENLREKPIKSYVQLIKVLIALVAFIFIVSIVVGQSPREILLGFGAVTAIVLLLFKDTILGLVASVQMSTIDMVRVGDWISMPKYGADGDVTEINLTSVKVQNWNKTITIIPSYAFVSDSFTNWRGMSESGGRRIKKALSLNMNSVRFLSQEEIEEMKEIDLLKPYIEKKIEELGGQNTMKNAKGRLINGRRLTNLGTFRAYAQAYLENHNEINQEMTCMARLLDPSTNGVALEIYCFSKNQEWAEYERIAADLLDHLLAVVSDFDLQLFQSPSGLDFKSAFRGPA